MAISSFGETMAMTSFRIGGGVGSAAWAAGGLAGRAASGAVVRLGGAADWQPSRQSAPRVAASASRQNAAIRPPAGLLIQRPDEATLLDLAQQAEIDEVSRLEAPGGRIGLAVERGL